MTPEEREYLRIPLTDKEIREFYEGGTEIPPRPVPPVKPKGMHENKKDSLSVVTFGKITGSGTAAAILDAIAELLSEDRDYAFTFEMDEIGRHGKPF